MQPGQVIGGSFRLRAPLGRGAFGEVWSADRFDGSEHVVLKFLHDLSPNAMARFQLEARALRELQHPGCVAFIGSGQTADGTPFIAMEHVDGTLLADLRGTTVPWPRAVSIVREIAEAVSYAHDHRIVHRDLKPENVMIVTVSGREVVKVLDFGIAKLAGRKQPDITKTGEILGTPQYMSPEQLRGRAIGPPTDQYALGVILFELLEGHLPFQGESMLEVAMGHLSLEVPRLSLERPEAVRTVVDRLLAKDPAQRYPDVRQLIGALDRAAVGRDVRSRAATNNSRGLLLVASVTLALIALIVAGVLVSRKEDDSPPPPVGQKSPLARALMEPTPIEKTSTEVDVGAPVDMAPAERSGCDSPPPFSSRGYLRAPDVLTILPPNYDSSRRYPVVFLLREVSQTPENIVSDTQFDELGAREEFIVATPSDILMPWLRAPEDMPSLTPALEAVKQNFCIDTDRIYALGYVSGGRAAMELACNQTEFAAIASSTIRHSPNEKVCQSPIPHIHLAPLKDGYNPIEGGRGCAGVEKLSLEAQERAAAKINGCTGERRVRSRYKGSTCYEWSCDEPFVSCHIDGGHNWPGGGRRVLNDIQELISGVPCDGTPADFPYGQTVWDFFEEVSAAAAKDRAKQKQNEPER